MRSRNKTEKAERLQAEPGFSQYKQKGLWLPDPGRDLNSNKRALYFLGLTSDKSHLK